MAIATRRAETTWHGPPASGTGLTLVGSGATGELAIAWASRTGRADGKTSPEELAAAAHSACFAMALTPRPGEHRAVPERLPVAATVALDEAGGVPAIVSSHLQVTARAPALDGADFDAVAGEASELCPVSRLFAGAKITVNAPLEPRVVLALPRPAEASLAATLVLATAVWVGGMVTILVVARVAHATLGAAERVAFFRSLGRAYGLVGGVALAAALASGAVLASRYRWDGQLAASTVVAAGLVAATVAGVMQARRMTRLRRDALRDHGNPELAAKVRRGARNAAALRAAIAALSLTLLCLGVMIAT